MYIQRAIEPVIQKMVKTFKVVLLTGARQVGKSTTLGYMFANQDYEYVSLEDLNELEIAKKKSKSFFSQPSRKIDY